MTAQIGGWQRNALLAGIAGVLASIVGMLLDREQFLRSYLFAYFVLDRDGNRMSGNSAAASYRRREVGDVDPADVRGRVGARCRIMGSVLVIPILVSIPTLYEWARPEAMNDPNIQSKAAYLNIPGFVGRAIFYFLVWTLYAHLLS